MLGRFFYFMPLLISIAGGFTPAFANLCGPKETLHTYQKIFSSHPESKLKPQVIEHQVVQATTRNPSATHLSFAEFKNKFPFDMQESANTQTWVTWNHEPYQIVAYHEATGQVQIARNILRNESQDALVKLNNGQDIAEGYIFHLKDNPNAPNSQTFEVIGVDLHYPFNPGLRRTNLAKRRVIDIPLSELAPSLETATILKGISERSLKEPVMPLVGDQVKLLSTATDDFVYPMGSSWKVIPELIEDYHLPEDYPLHIKYLDRSNKTIPLNDLQYENYSTIDEVFVYSNDPKPKVMVRYKGMVSSKKSPGEIPTSKLFNMTPVKSHVYEFELAGSGGTKKMKIYMPQSKDAAKDLIDQRRIEDFLKTFPEPLKQTTDIVLFDPSNSGTGFAGSSKVVKDGIREHQMAFYRNPSWRKNEVRTTFVGDILDRPEVIETSWHELTHNFEIEFRNRIPGFKMEMWEDAIIKDGAWPSNYSRVSSSEDFPETMMAYIRSDGGRLDPTLRAKFKHRFELLDRAFRK